MLTSTCLLLINWSPSLLHMMPSQVGKVERKERTMASPSKLHIVDQHEVNLHLCWFQCYQQLRIHQSSMSPSKRLHELSIRSVFRSRNLRLVVNSVKTWGITRMWHSHSHPLLEGLEMRNSHSHCLLSTAFFALAGGEIRLLFRSRLDPRLMKCTENYWNCYRTKNK